MTAALKQAAQIKIQMNVVGGPHAGQSFLFYKTPLTIGRGPENDIVLLNDPLVSRSHARIDLNQSVFEITNLSEKNILTVHSEVISKSVLVNDSLFKVGDTEMSFQFDLCQAVVNIQPTATVQAQPNKAQANIVHAQAITPKSNSVAVKSIDALKISQPKAAAPFAQKINSPPTLSGNNNNRMLLYIIIAVILGLGSYFFLTTTAKVKTSKPKPILKYADEITVGLNSQKEEELRKKREEEKKIKSSPQIQRADENFIKGMRDFQHGNYARAQDFFQVVLNLIPDHALARRHLYLAKVRFDELVKVKLMLGESNYQKHNFSMCESLYKQVMDMLQGKSNDQNFKLAKSMAEKCQLAAEGIR